MHKARKINNQKGITLVALIITIIVMLILALVAIQAVTGTGIIKHANEAQRQHQRAQAEEEIMLALNEWEVVKTIETNPDLKGFLDSKFESVTESEGNYIVTVRGFQATVNSDGKLVGELIEVGGEIGTDDEETPEETLPISITLDKTEITTQITSGSTATETITATLNNATGDLTWTSSDTSIAEISGNGNTGTITLKKAGTVTIVISYGAYKVECKITVTEKEITVSDLQGKVLSTTENTEVKDEYGNKIVVPAGFKITTDASNVTEGIVIEDCTDTATKGSQFVWIPVGDIYTTTDEEKTEENTKTITLGRYSGTTLMQPIEGTNTYSQSVQIEGGFYESNANTFYEKTVANGGYYFGRYEAGDSETIGERTSSTSDENTMVCKEGQYVYNYVTPEVASNLCLAMYSSTNFTSALINSYSWDTALMFINEFSGNSSYSSETTLNGSVSTTGTINDKVCNIYGMASNYGEVTTEKIYIWENTISCVRSYCSLVSEVADSPKTRWFEYNNSADYEISFRPIIYITGA